MNIIVLAIIRYALAAVLVVAGAAKLSDLDSFALTLRTVKFGPSRLSFASAAGIALGEISLSFALLATEPNFVVGILVALFMVAFVVVGIHGSRVSGGVACRCFGALTERHFGRAMIAQACVLLGLSLSALAIEMRGSLSPSPPLTLALLPVLAEYAMLGVVSAQASRVLTKVAKV
jgi:hypothetical protein